MRSDGALSIGYLWQYDGYRPDNPSASVLHIQAVVRALGRQGHSVRTVTLDGTRARWSDDLDSWEICPAPPRAPLARGFESVVRGLQGRLHLPYLNLFESDRFARACTSCLAGCDVLYERYWLMNAGGVLAARRLGIPIVLEVNGDVLEEYKQLGLPLSPPQRLAIERLNRSIFSHASHVVTVSEALRQRTRQRWQIPADKISVVHNGAEVESFAAAGVDGERADPERLTIAFTGSFKPWHGLEGIVSTFGRIAEQHPCTRLLLIGDGPLRGRIEQQVVAAGLRERVHFTGSVPHENVPNLLAHSDIAVIGIEPVPGCCHLKAFEYMAAGLPIAAPATPNIDEFLDDGATALLYDPGDAGALGAALTRLLEDRSLRVRLGREAQRRALKRHSWSATADKLLATMRDTIRRAARERSRQ